MLRSLAGDGQPVELARKAHGEVADVDHLLHFAFALGEDLAGLQRDESAEVGLGGAQGIAELADGLPANRGGRGPPLQERLLRAVDSGLVVALAGFAHAGDDIAVDGRDRIHNRPAAAPASVKHAGVHGADAKFFKPGFHEANH